MYSCSLYDDLDYCMAAGMCLCTCVLTICGSYLQGVVCIHESSVGLSSTTNPSLGVAIPVPAQTHLYTHAKGRAT